MPVKGPGLGSPGPAPLDLRAATTGQMASVLPNTGGNDRFPAADPVFRDRALGVACPPGVLVPTPVPVPVPTGWTTDTDARAHLPEGGAR